ncbi:MAG: EF-hand domain-containing protein [Bradyrhizobium sp.]|nr:EF-hand domain-containing protein [Bradyrhizobium sp.]
MAFPALLLALLAAAPASQPITVTGHAWAPFISPMGEPFRARTRTDDTLALWFARADANRDGTITPDEMQADAARFFATLDTNSDGEIDPEELVHYEWEVAPDIQVSAKMRPAPGETAEFREKSRRDADLAALDDEDFPKRRGKKSKQGNLEGAARYGLLNLPEPVAAADADFNRGVSLEEFRLAAASRFQILDTARQGRLSLPQLQEVRAAHLLDGKARLKDGAPDRRIGSALPTGN